MCINIKSTVFRAGIVDHIVIRSHHRDVYEVSDKASGNEYLGNGYLSIIFKNSLMNTLYAGFNPNGCVSDIY